MTAAPKLRFSFEEYLQVDADSSVKHEFLDGMILAMAGGTPNHAALAAAVTATLTRQLEGKRCRVYSEALRVGVPSSGFAGYPEVTIVCAKLELDPRDVNTVTNPTVLVEILSPSTEDYDRGEKFAHYRQIASLAHVVFVAHDQQRIEAWHHDNGAWTATVAGSGEQVALAGVSCTLDVDRIYRDPLNEE